VRVDEAQVLKPPAARARRIALVLSAVAVAFSLVCGFFARRAFALRADPDSALVPTMIALSLLCVALLFRMGAAICELLWLERTWSNLPESYRKVGPVDNVSSALLIGVSLMPGIAWVWKLGLVASVADGFENVRRAHRFRAPVPKRLGMAAVIFGWIPGLNVYVAPFLWEMFATRIDVVVDEIRALIPSSRT